MMSNSELTSEEQETIQKSKDPSIVKTANGTTRTTEEATVCVCDSDMFVQVPLSKESRSTFVEEIFRRERLLI